MKKKINKNNNKNNEKIIKKIKIKNKKIIYLLSFSS